MRKRILFALILIFTLFVSTNLQSDTKQNKIDKKTLKKSEKLRKKGDKQLKKNHIAEAIKYYKESLKIYPDNKTANNNMAIAYIKNKKYEKALTYLEKTLAIDLSYKDAKQNIVKLLLLLGNNASKSRNIKDAVIYFEKALKYIENNDKNKNLIINIYYSISVDFYNLREHKKSIEYLKKMLNTLDFKKEYPKYYPFSIYLMGVNYSVLKEYRKSNEFLKVYIELKKENKGDTVLPLSYYLIGHNNFLVLKDMIKKEAKKQNKIGEKEIVKLAEGFKDKIEPFLSKAIELKKDFENAYTDLGNLYYFLQDYDKSIEIYNKLISSFPNSPSIEIYKNFKEKLLKLKNRG